MTWLPASGSLRAERGDQDRDRRIGDETAGVIVDEVEEVLTVEEADFEEVPGADSELIEAIAKLGDRLVVLLKPSTIFVGLGELAAQAA